MQIKKMMTRLKKHERFGKWIFRVKLDRSCIYAAPRLIAYISAVVSHCEGRKEEKKVVKIQQARLILGNAV